MLLHKSNRQKFFVGRYKKNVDRQSADMKRLIEKAATVDADLSAEKLASVNSVLVVG